MPSPLQARIEMLLAQMQYWEATPSPICYNVSVDAWLQEPKVCQDALFGFSSICAHHVSETGLPRPRSAFEWFSTNVDMSQEREAHGEVFLPLIIVHVSDSSIQIAASQLIWRNRMSLGVVL